MVKVRADLASAARGQEVVAMTNQPKMLEGYRVLDFTRYVAGPTCSRLMAEMGAEV